MITQNEIKKQFYGYLTEMFGDKFTNLIEPPERVLIGERVLYRLVDDKVAERKEMTEKDIDNLHQMLMKIAGESGAVITEPPITSGLPYPRMVDITDWSDAAMDIPAKKYATSDDLLPKDTFSIEWLFGVMFGPSDKQLVYIDFTHPRVKLVFAVYYESEYELTFCGNRNKMKDWLMKFNEKRAKIINEVEMRPELSWVKIIQLNDQILTQYKLN